MRSSFQSQALLSFLFQPCLPICRKLFQISSEWNMQTRSRIGEGGQLVALMMIRIGVQFSCSFGGFRPWWVTISMCSVSHKFSVGILWHQSTCFLILVRILRSILGRVLVQSISQYLLNQEPCSQPTLRPRVYILINLGLLYCWPCIWKWDRSQNYRLLRTSRWRP